MKHHTQPTPRIPARCAGALRSVVLLLALLCGLASPLWAQTPSHVYDFTNSCADANGGPAIVPNGGTLGATSYTFAEGQGLSLPGTVLANPGEYTIEMKFKFTTTSSYRNILNFGNTPSNFALYVSNGSMILYPVGSSPGFDMIAGQVHRVVMTRNATTKLCRVFVDGLQKVAVVDADDFYVSGTAGAVHFFRDDLSEQSGGTVDQIRTYDAVLTLAQVGALDGLVFQPPTVSSISPTSGPLAGGKDLVVQGTNFVAGTSVTIGGVEATNVRVLSATEITCKIPPASAGTASVVVISPGGSATAGSLFTYTPAPPTVSSISPVSGSTGGGAIMTIEGTNFFVGTSVTVGGVGATAVGVLSETMLTCNIPPGAAGMANVVVTTPDGSATAGSQYTYIEATGDPDGLNVSLDGAIYATAVQPDGKIIIGGDFVTVAGVARKYVARLNANGTLDTGFDPSADSRVSAVAVQADGKVLLGGEFTALQPNGAGSPTTRNYVARVNADGTLDTEFDPNPNGGVLCVVEQADGKVLLGGGFTSLQPNEADSPTTRLHVARVNANGTLDTGFNPQADAVVYSVAVQTDGKVLLGGNFTTLQPNGAPSSTARNHVARVNADGELDTGFDPNASDAVQTVTLQADGKVLLGGFFTSLQPPGEPSPRTRNYVARVNSDGTLDTGFDPNLDTFALTSIAVQADGKVLLGGFFTSLKPNGDTLPTTRNYVARVNADGTLDTNFNPNADNFVSSLAVQADGKVLLGGEFTTLGGSSFFCQRFARIANDSATQTLTASNSTEVLWTRGGTAPELSAVTFEKSTDGGANWTSVGAGTRVGTTSNWALTGLSLSGSGQVRARGRTSGGFCNGSGGLIEQVAAFTFGPIVTTPTSTNVTSSGATLGGNVTSDNGSTITERGVVFSLTSANADPQIGGTGVTKVTATGTTGVFTAAVSSLSASSAYTFKAYAKNAIGTGYTSAATFTTLATPAPEIAVEQPALTNLVDGDTVGVDFGTLTRGSSAEKTFTIKNTGNANLTIGVISKDGANSSDFIVKTTSLSSPVTGGGSTTFTVTFSPTADSARAAAIHIANNDGNEAPFDIVLKGTGVAPTSATSKPVVKSGGTVPGAGGTVLIPSDRRAAAAIAPAGDAKFTSVGVPAINEGGDVVAFLGTWAQSTGKGSVLVTETECLAAVGAAVTPISGATYKKLSDPVVGGDTVAFIATLAGVAKAESTAVFLRKPNTAPTVLAQTGKDAPDFVGGSLGETFKKFKGIAVSGDHAAIYAQLSDKTNGIWVTNASGELRLVLLEGVSESVGGGAPRTVKKVVTFMVGKTSPGQGRGWLTTDTNGDAVALALVTYSDKKTEVQLATIGNSTAVSVSGLDFASYGVPTANGDGDSAFFGSRVIGGAVTKANAKGIFLDDTGTGHADVARVGGQAGANGETFSVLSDPVLGADGGLAFFATLKGGNAKGLAAKTLWWQPAGQPLEQLAQGGGEAGGLPGSQWKAFSSLAIAGGGRGPIFAATLVPGKGNVTKATASGVWATDAAGNPRLLFRTGDTIDGKTLKKFTLLNATVGSTGVTRSFNDKGRVVWQATFTDKSTAIITTEVP